MSEPFLRFFRHLNELKDSAETTSATPTTAPPPPPTQTLSAWHTTCTDATLGLTLGRPRSQHQPRNSAGGASLRDVPSGPAGLNRRRPPSKSANLARLAELSVAVQRELGHLAGAYTRSLFSSS
jgi:hypothetical protein